MDIICEILKTLYNLTINQGDQETTDTTEHQNFLNLSVILQKLLVISTQSPDRKTELTNHIVNLITNMPVKCVNPLIVQIEKGKKIPEEMQYEKHDVTALHSILCFLKNKFSVEPVCRKTLNKWLILI